MPVPGNGELGTSRRALIYDPRPMRQDMRRFWDRRAEEDAFFFVDNRLEYGQPDLERFWSDGERDLAKLLDAVGAALKPSDDVLEIGCGVGRLTRSLSAQTTSVRALDVSERMLALAQRHNGGLGNVEWVLGDGSTLAPIDSGSADACISHVVFQHIPDPAVTLSYVREMGRVLRTGGWAAFQISNDPRVHDAGPALRRARRSILATLGRGPRGQNDCRWRGSMIELDALREAASAGGMSVERIVGEGTQLCCVLTRRR
jgi:SAM-dependent methyltransferase